MEDKTDHVKYYGYKHWTLEDPPRCFNVGKGVKGRPGSNANRNHKWHAIVKRLGLRAEICVGPMKHFDACSWEIENIEVMGTYSTNHSHDDLSDIGCNFTFGGEGTPGWVPSAATRVKLSVKLVGRKLGPQSPSHLQNRVRALQGRKAHVWSAEDRLKQSARLKGRLHKCSNCGETGHHRTRCSKL